MAGQLLLAGYLGAGNLGDDAVMLGLVHGLGGRPFHVTVLSGNPEDTHRLYGFPSVPRRDMKAVEQAIAACDALVFPGGSIFQDVTSVRSSAYYAQLIKMAKKAGKRVLLLGQGVGPLNTFLGKRMAKSAFEMADAITVRDPVSLQTLRDLGVTRPTKVAADSAFLLPVPVAVGDNDGFTVGSMKAIGLAPRPIKDKGSDVAGLFGEFAKLLYQSGSMPVLIAMDREEDGPLIGEVSKRQGGKVPDLRKLTTPMQVQQRISRMDGIVAMRLHAGILAATVGIPALMVSYDPKVTAFAKALDLNSAVSMKGLTAARLLESFIAFQKDRDRNMKLLEKRRAEQQALAEASIEVLLHTVK